MDSAVPNSRFRALWAKLGGGLWPADLQAWGGSALVVSGGNRGQGWSLVLPHLKAESLTLELGLKMHLGWIPVLALDTPSSNHTMICQAPLW